MVSWRRGIEPVIAAVILIAVAIVVAVAVVGWILGLWGGLAGGSPQISITDAKLCSGTSTIYAAIYIRNSGSGSDKILSVLLDYGGDTYVASGIYSSVPTTVSPQPPQLLASIVGTNTLTTPAEKTIPGNGIGWLYITFNVQGKTVSAGDQALLRITFEKSGTQSIPVRAESCPTPTQTTTTQQTTQSAATAP